MCVLPVPLLPRAMMFSRRRMYSQRASSRMSILLRLGMAVNVKVSRLLVAGKWAWRIRRSTRRRSRSIARDVQASIDAFSNTPDRRYLHRLEVQRDRLANPDLRLVGAVLRQLCEEDLSRRAVLEPALEPLLSRHPYLAVLHRQSESEA